MSLPVAATEWPFTLKAARSGKIGYEIETSRRMIDRAYYFRNGTPVLAVEISHLLIDDKGERLPMPRFEASTNYRLDKPEKIPLEKIVIETDAPYLSPEPLRGKINYPQNIVFTLKKIAEIKGMKEKETAEQIYFNTLRLFDIACY